MTTEQATNVLRYVGAETSTDFHTLSATAVDNLIAFANDFKYRRPRNANGSRARYFFAFVCRVARRA